MVAMAFILTSWLGNRVVCVFGLVVGLLFGTDDGSEAARNLCVAVILRVLEC